MKTGNVLAGLLAGVAVGAVLGILFAPDKGSNTRKRILSKSKDCTDSVKDKISELGNTLMNKADDVEQEAEQMASKGKEKYDEVKRDLEQATA
jgi:gas vesicle protein